MTTPEPRPTSARGTRFLVDPSFSLNRRRKAGSLVRAEAAASVNSVRVCTLTTQGAILLIASAYPVLPAPSRGSNGAQTTVCRHAVKQSAAEIAQTLLQTIFIFRELPVFDLTPGPSLPEST